ncbi:NAD(P)-dependent oxidoreductase [Pseudonocardia nematodicida]|uniref:NAD(P)-dependent oxidoreductase n=1 Tax=Pseudonocardia nematodicida TaxID=1206997 RepID=A0ABV1K6R1_9PSEU
MHAPVVVLGASGFLGSHLVRALRAGGHPVRAVSRTPARVPEDCGVEVVLADLSVPGAAAVALEGASAVVHLVADIDTVGGRGWRTAEGAAGAATPPDRVLTEVVEALAAAPDPLPVVWTGSVAQVGERESTLVTGTEPDHPETAYDRGKCAAEAILLDAGRRGVLRPVPVRLPTLYGPPAAPGCSAGGGVVTAMVRRALAGDPLTMWNDGRIDRDLLHVADTAAALVHALSLPGPRDGRAWLVGGDAPVELGTLFERISATCAAVTGKPPVPVQRVPAPDYATAADLRGIAVDSTPFRLATGWTPRVGLADGLRETVAHVARN